MKDFLKRLVGFSLGPIIGAGLSFLTTPLYTNNISTAEYGKAQVFLSSILLIQSLIYLGMDQAYTREFNESQDEGKLFQNAIFIPLLASLVIVAFIVIFPQQTAQWLYQDPSEIWPALAFGLMVLFMVLERFILLYIRMHERAFEYSFFNIVLKLNTLILAFIMIAWGSLSFHLIVYSTVAGQVLADLYLLIRYRHLFKIEKDALDPTLMKSMLHFGLPVMLSTVVFTSLKQLDVFFLRHYTDEATLGLYGSALKIASLIGIIKTAFTSFWVPTAYRWYDEDKPMTNFIFISDLMMLIMTLAFFFIVFGKGLIVKILGSDYYEASFLMALLALPELLYTASETTTLGIVFSRQSRLNIVVSAVSLIPTVLMNFILTPRLGGLGAAIASTLGFMTFFALRTYFSNRTGFVIPVKHQFGAVFVMLACGILNALGPVAWWINAGLLLMALLVQYPVFISIHALIKDPQVIDFS